MVTTLLEQSEWNEDQQFEKEDKKRLLKYEKVSDCQIIPALHF